MRPRPCPLAQVVTIQKKKRFFLSPGHGHSLNVTEKSGTTYEFHAIGERDTCVKTIVSTCSAAGLTPTVLEVGK